MGMGILLLGARRACEGPLDALVVDRRLLGSACAAFSSCAGVAAVEPSCCEVSGAVDWGFAVDACFDRSVLGGIGFG